MITGQFDALPTRLEIPETDDEEEDEDQTIIDLPLANLNQELGVEDFASAEVETFSLGDLLSPHPPLQQPLPLRQRLRPPQ